MKYPLKIVASLKHANGICGDLKKRVSKQIYIFSALGPMDVSE